MFGPGRPRRGRPGTGGRPAVAPVRAEPAPAQVAGGATGYRAGYGSGDGRTGQAGYVTAETALAMPALLAVLALCLAVLSAIHAQLRSTDAAAAAARAAARGETPSTVRAVAVRLAPQGAAVAVRAGGDDVEIVVRSRVRPLGLPLPALEVQGRAVAAREPGTAPAPAGRASP